MVGVEYDFITDKNWFPCLKTYSACRVKTIHRDGGVKLELSIHSNPIQSRFQVYILCGQLFPLLTLQGGFSNCSPQFSVPKWRMMGSQSEVLFHEIHDVQKILVGWTTFFFLVLKFGRNSEKKHPVHVTTLTHTRHSFDKHVTWFGDQQQWMEGAKKLQNKCKSCQTAKKLEGCLANWVVLEWSWSENIVAKNNWSLMIYLDL